MMTTTVLLAILSLTTTLCNGQVKFPGQSEKPLVSTEPVPPPQSPPGEAKNPEARFFPGIFSEGSGLFGDFGRGGGLFGLFGGGRPYGGGGLFGNIFNPCGSCSPYDPQDASLCCQRGHRHCCKFLGGGLGGFGGYEGGLVGPGKPGIYGGGSAVVGPPGYIPGSGFGGGQFSPLKPGFCPKATLFGGGLFDDPLGSKKSKIIPLDDKTKVTFIDKQRKKREDEKPSVTLKQNDGTQGRLFEKIPNIFCQHDCYSDLDCAAYLKCCIDFTNCRKCTQPLPY